MLTTVAILILLQSPRSLFYRLFSLTLFLGYFSSVYNESFLQTYFPTPHKTKIQTGWSVLLESSLLPSLVLMFLFDLVFYLILKQRTVQLAQSPKSMEREQQSLHLDVSVTRISTSDPRLGTQTALPSCPHDEPFLGLPHPQPWASGSSSHYTPVPPGV